MKHPTKPGVYWAALDDSVSIVEIALLQVRYFTGTKSFDDGADVRFVDETDRRFTMRTIDQEIVRPGRDVVLASASFSYDPEVRITWLGPVAPKRSFPKVGDAARPD